MEDLSAAAAAADSLDDNATIREYLELRLGPQHILLPIVIPLTILYVVVFVSGVVGNVTVCLIIARNSHFQTPTNYYLFSLAISDLLILVFACGASVFGHSSKWADTGTPRTTRQLFSDGPARNDIYSGWARRHMSRHA
ncbi:G-protein receptor, putative [Ixodes scapularis]|uniref:G-protein receptor, putative n=1 Tax=Ixodes scapularis TaxID=6945 RepID=B7P5G9_IXOSC|nr:G-protein receptor, putative [Ixodes scapularis]|eukprot:XP_002407371.1 G-protein receptor, putative [Ixodes scapularis]